MARCTKEEALETRSRILDAAEDVFHTKGVSQTTLHDVAVAANVTRGAIYWHFKNKADLFDAMFERVRLPIEAMGINSVTEEETDPLGQLRSICLFIFQDTVRNPRSRKVLDIVFHRCEWVDEAGPIPSRQRVWFEQGTANIQRLIGFAVARGQLPSDLDVNLAAVTLHAMIDGLLNNWLFSPGSFSLDSEAERLVDACLDTLRYGGTLRRARPPDLEV
jgi:TetR/AcrR family acrAB operon transcriptional repressor